MAIDNVCIVGAAAAPVGRYADPGGPFSASPEPELLGRIAMDALENAGIDRSAVGSAVFTAALPDADQQGLATHMAARLGLRCTGQLSEVAQMGITGGLAFDQAAADLQLGRARVALALGVAYPSRAASAPAMARGLRVVADAEFQASYGATPIAWYALDAARYLHETGARREDVASVAVKSREFARLNPLAQFKDRLTLDQVLAARPIVDPLGQHEVPAVGDGAICLVLATEAVARAGRRPFVRLRGRGFAHDGHHPIGSHPHDITRFPALREASAHALNEAGVDLGAIDLAELYAPCTITEVLATEAVGWFERGAGAHAAACGATSLHGRIPINTSGGCLSRGHPPTLTGLYGLFEIYEQLTGRAGRRQIAAAQLAMAACEGGNYNTALVHVLEAVQ